VYSSIGIAVNLAARLCSVAEGGEILIDERTFQLIGSRLKAEQQPSKMLKGFDQPVPVWRVNGVSY
jgi:adenylate cyclase